MSVGPATADVAARSQAPRTVLHITGLSKTFPGTKALDDVALEVAEELIKRPDVFPGNDGLLPGCDQTYTMA